MAVASGHRHVGKAGPQPGAQKTPTLLAQRPEVHGHGSAALVPLGGSEGQPVPWCRLSVWRLPAVLGPQTFSASHHVVGRVSRPLSKGHQLLDWDPPESRGTSCACSASSHRAGPPTSPDHQVSPTCPTPIRKRPAPRCTRIRQTSQRRGSHHGTRRMNLGTEHRARGARHESTDSVGAQGQGASEQSSSRRQSRRCVSGLGEGPALRQTESQWCKMNTSWRRTG